MPVTRLTYEQTRALELRDINPSPYVLDEAQARAALGHLLSQGFRDLPVYLCAATHPWPGDLVGSTIRIFALPEVDVPATLTHEYGHAVWDWLGDTGRQAYLMAKFGRLPDVAPGLQDEMFAEDFRQLFGSPDATKSPHKYDDTGIGLGYGLPDAIQDMQGWPERRLRLRAMIMVTVVKQPGAPEPTKPGASVFSDVSGHWAEADIVAAAEAGVLKGDPDGRFRPNDKVTRAELATVVARLLRQT